MSVEEDWEARGMGERGLVPVVERAGGIERVDSEVVEDCCWTVWKYL